MAERIGILLSLIVLVIALAAGGMLPPGMPDSPPGIAPEEAAMYEDFTSGFLNRQVWAITGEGDARQRVINVSDVDPTENRDYRLTLGIDTVGTRDDTVKFAGIRTIRRINLDGERVVSVDLDWNNQRNGCYLTASLYLCPTITEGNPEDEQDWLKFEYSGVPPGHNARSVIASKVNGSVRYLYTEGWPDQRIGRPIGNQRIVIVTNEGRIRVSENGTEIYRSRDGALTFTSAHIYLQMSSHSNYPLRIVCFDNVIAV